MMAELTSSSVIFYSSLTLLIAIYLTLILAIIEIRNFWKCANFNHPFFKCRQPALHVAYIVAFLFVLYILNPIILIVANIVGTTSSVPFLVNDIADILIFSTLFPRAWIIWFDRAFIDNLKNWIWRREIDPQDGQHNILVRYRKYLVHSHIYIYCAYSVFIAPVFIVLHIFPHFHLQEVLCRVLTFSLLIIMLVSTLRVVRKISLVTDEYNIRAELFSCIKYGGSFYLVGQLLFEALEVWHQNEHVALLLETFCISVTNVIVLYYTMHWTRMQYFVFQKLNYMKQLKLHGTRASFASFSALMVKRVQFQQIMSNRRGIEAFCNHLQHEMGLESILFLFEVTQFKSIVRRLSNNALTDNVPDLCDWRNELAGQHSHANHHHYRIGHDENIVFSAKNVLHVSWLPVDPRMFTSSPYQLALHLYDKYVDESASLCINVSWEQRKTIYRYFQELAKHNHTGSIHDMNGAAAAAITDDPSAQDGDAKEMQQFAWRKYKTDKIKASVHKPHEFGNPLFRVYKIYDEAFKEVWNLLKNDSFLRFMGTEECRRLIYVIFPEDAKEAERRLIENVDTEIRKQLDQQAGHAQQQAFRRAQSAPPTTPDVVVVRPAAIEAAGVHEQLKPSIMDIIPGPVKSSPPPVVTIQPPLVTKVTMPSSSIYCESPMDVAMPLPTINAHRSRNSNTMVSNEFEFSQHTLPSMVLGNSNNSNVSNGSSTCGEMVEVKHDPSDHDLLKGLGTRSSRSQSGDAPLKQMLSRNHKQSSMPSLFSRYRWSGKGGREKEKETSEIETKNDAVPSTSPPLKYEQTSLPNPTLPAWPRYKYQQTTPMPVGTKQPTLTLALPTLGASERNSSPPPNVAHLRNILNGRSASLQTRRSNPDVVPDFTDFSRSHSLQRDKNKITTPLEFAEFADLTHSYSIRKKQFRESPPPVAPQPQRIEITDRQRAVINRRHLVNDNSEDSIH